MMNFINLMIHFAYRVMKRIGSILFPKSFLPIYQMKFEVCSACQNTCVLCAHDVLIRAFRGYQLSLDELDKFIYYTRKSKYYVSQLWIQGPGEPTLWKYFNEGINRLYRSGVIGSINIETNGLSLDSLTNQTWSYLNKIYVSIYPDFDKKDFLESLKKRYPHKIIEQEVSQFEEVSPEKQLSNIPASCGCAGPMFVKDKIFYYCGPTGFSAAKAMGKNIFDFQDLFKEIGLNYLENADFTKLGNMEICRYCFSNSNAIRTLQPHRSTK